jgi:hypothetical protein
MVGAPMMQEPNPASVSTVTELAYELRLLKIHAGDPSVRELSRTARSMGAVLPHSTAQDALSGKRGLPRLPTVLALVRALGVTETDPWRDAWRRAGQDWRGLHGRSGRRPAVGVPPRAGPGTTRLAAVNAARAADLIETLPIAQVLEQLAAMPATDAAPRLELVRPARAAEVLAVLDEGRARATLAIMRPDLAADALSAMPPSSAARLLDEMPDHRHALIQHLGAERAAPILAEGWTGGEPG